MPGYYFDSTSVTYAGTNATTTTCASGLVGYSTRLCVWNGASSAAGTWADPVNNCVRTSLHCLPCTAWPACACAAEFFFLTGASDAARGHGPTAIACDALTNFKNASFSSVLIEKTSGSCNTGYAGTISATCTLNSGTTTANFANFTGACTRTSIHKTRVSGRGARVQRQDGFAR